jgi:TonB family protein
MNALPRRLCLGILSALASATISSAQPLRPEVADRGLKILNSNVVRVVYPFDLAMAGTDATVDVSYRVDAEGAATGVTVTKASHPDAAAAFLAALEEMAFETAKVDGKPVLSDPQTLSISIRQLQLSTDLNFISVIKNPAAVVVGVREVDGGLKPAGPMAPALFPASLRKSGIKQGQAVLEFYIDPAGVVRLPKVLSATDPALGWSAASAVLTWRFAPPKKGGEAAIVKVTGLPVAFTAPPEPAPAPLAGGIGQKVEIYVEAPQIINAQLKLDAEVIGTLPLRILLEVAEDGSLTRDHDLTVNNPNVAGTSKFTLAHGEHAPARIKFTPTTPEVQGTAVIKR